MPGSSRLRPSSRPISAGRTGVYLKPDGHNRYPRSVMANENPQDDYESQMGDVISNEKKREQSNDQLWRERLEDANAGHSEGSNAE
jgi:hypothetical protein